MATLQVISGPGEGQNYPLEVGEVHSDDVQRNNLGSSRRGRAAGSGPTNAKPRCMSDVTRRPDKIAEAMIICTPNSSRECHDSIITAIAPDAIPRRANRTSVQQGQA